MENAYKNAEYLYLISEFIYTIGKWRCVQNGKRPGAKATLLTSWKQKQIKYFTSPWVSLTWAETGNKILTL